MKQEYDAQISNNTWTLTELPKGQLIFCNDEALKSDLKAKLSSTFRMKDMGSAVSCSGIRITRTERSVSLDQRFYFASI